MISVRLILSVAIAGICVHASGQGTSGSDMPMALPQVKTTAFKKDTFNIVQHGAVSDGITLNTKSINAAIDACSRNGGGVVLVPVGLWLTGPVVLKSNVNLHLNRNALLQFTDDKDQYPLVKANWEGIPQMRNQS